MNYRFIFEISISISSVMFNVDVLIYIESEDIKCHFDYN